MIIEFKKRKLNTAGRKSAAAGKRHLRTEEDYPEENGYPEEDDFSEDEDFFEPDSDDDETGGADSAEGKSGGASADKARGAGSAKGTAGSASREDYPEDKSEEDYAEDDSEEDYEEDDSEEDYPEDESGEDYPEDDSEEDYPEDDYDEDYPEDYDDWDEEDRGSGLFGGIISLPVLSAAIITVAVLTIALFAILINRNWFYSHYEVVFSRAQEDAISFSYCNVNGNILRYGVDGATLYDQEGNTIWDVAYDMDEPAVETRGEVLAIYDKSGTSMVVCDESGQTGAITTKHPVIRAAIARQGTVATIQEDRRNAWIEYYSKEGETIAEIKTSIEDPGYPMDLAISPDGLLLAVAYTSFSEGEQTGSILFYSFGTFGQNQMDNRVASFEYAGRVIPEVGNLGENGFVAFRDNGFSLYSGGGIPEQRADIMVDGQIEAIFYDEVHIGLLVQDPTDGLKHMRVFDSRGGELTDKPVEVNFQKAELFGNEVNFYNGAGLRVYTLSGIEKFNSSYDEPAQAFFAIGKYRYVAVTENSVDLIRLK